MAVAAAVSARFCLSGNFIFLLHSSWFSLPSHDYRPPNRVDADTKTQGQSLDDGLSRIRHTNCECELAQLVQEERSNDGRDRKTTTTKQRRSAENNDSNRRQKQGVALECCGFASDAGQEQASNAIEELGIDIGQKLMKLHPKSRGLGSQWVCADRFETPSGRRLFQDE